MKRFLDRLFGTAEEINGAHRCDTYLFRWALLKLPQGRSVYLHNFVGNDWSRDLHDHPKRFISIGLWGRYLEETPKGKRIYRAPWIRTFKAEHRHRLSLIDRKPCWTLVIVLKSTRQWGFWHSGRFIHWKEYVYGADAKIADEMKDCL